MAMPLRDTQLLISMATETKCACLCGCYGNPSRARCTEDKVPIWRNCSQKTHSLQLSVARPVLVAVSVLADFHFVSLRDPWGI